MTNKEELLQQLTQWHRDGEHQKIIQTIEALPERDFVLTGLLGRAYNNLAMDGDYPPALLERAITILESVSAEGENDATWHYRLGYSLFFLGREEEALVHFRRALELNPEEMDVPYFIDRCRRSLEGPSEKTGPVHVTLHLNARLQPRHRHDLEDAIDVFLEEYELGAVEGGGTALAPTGEVKSCDIEIELRNEDSVGQLMNLMDHIQIPKGSQLLCGEGRDFPVGDMEGLALRLNGTDLPDEVYQNYDINYVIDRIEELLGDMVSLYSWWEGPQDTVLYYYGGSYVQMYAAIRDFLQEYPLCQKCLVTQIA